MRSVVDIGNVIYRCSTRYALNALVRHGISWSFNLALTVTRSVSSHRTAIDKHGSQWDAFELRANLVSRYLEVLATQTFLFGDESNSIACHINRRLVCMRAARIGVFRADSKQVN